MPQDGLPPPAREQTSALVRRVLNDLRGERVSIGYVVFQFRRRSFGGILILLTVLALMPVISFFAGLVMIIPALQMAAGLKAPVLPRLIAERQIAVARLQAIGDRLLPWVERAETIVRPRWLIFTTAPVPMLLGIVIAGLALVVTLPLPLVNFPPVIALLLLSMGILERDGVMIVFGLIAAALALLLGLCVALLAIDAASLALRSQLG